MSEDRTEEDTAFDADQLAALARPSLPPVQDDDDDDDDSALDLKALTASMAPPPSNDDDDDDDDDGRVSVGSAAAATSGEAVSSAKSATPESKPIASSGKSDDKTDNEIPVAAVAAAEPASGGSGKMLIGLIAVLGLGAVVFALTQDSAGQEQAALYPAETPVAHEEPVEPEEETTPAVDPVTDETEPDDGVLPDDGVVPEATYDEVLALGGNEAEATPAVAGNRPRRRREGSSMNTTSMTDSPAATMDSSMEAEAEAEATMVAETMEAEPTMETSSMDDMDDLLTRALGGTPTAGGTMTEATMEVAMEDRSALPETPSRSAVTRALGGLMARMRQCAGDQVGMATARIRVNNNGQVASANIGGSPFGGTPQGTCMERVVRTARFPRFQRTHFDVTYPFSIRPIN